MIVGTGDHLGGEIGGRRLNGLHRGRLGRLPVQEQLDRLVGDAGPSGDLSHREVRCSDLGSEFPGGSGDRRHAAEANADFDPQSSAESSPRVFYSAPWHNQGMASFPANLRTITASPASIRKVAKLAGIDEKTVRNWKVKIDASTMLKAKQLLDAIGLPWPDALGDYTLTEEWKAKWRARFEKSPPVMAIACIRSNDWEKMTPAQRAAVQAVIDAFAPAPEAKPQRQRKAG